jgi:hypothetical protein
LGEDSSAVKHRRYFKNYLIDKSLQLRYVVIVALISAALAAGLGFLLSRQAAFASDTIIASMSGMEDFLGPEVKAEIVASLRNQDRSQLTTMVVVGLGLMIVLTGFLIVMTHKVAGPLYKVSYYFDRMTEGKLPRVTALRKGDQLQDFFQKFQDMDEALRVRCEAEIALLAKFLAEADQAGVAPSGELGHQLDELRSLLKSKRDSLS